LRVSDYPESTLLTPCNQAGDAGELLVSIQARSRTVLSVVLFSLSGCGQLDAPDTWGAIPADHRLTVPVHASRQNRGGPDDVAARQTARAVDPALERIKDLTTGGKPPRTTRAGLEWRSEPGLSEALLWRLELANLSGEWSQLDRLGGPVKPAQRWRWLLSVKPKMRPDSAFVLVADGERETPEGDWSADRGSGAVRADWRPACEAMGRELCSTNNFPRVSAARVGFFLQEDGSRDMEGRVEVGVEHIPGGPASTASYTVETKGREGSDGSGRVEAVQVYRYASGESALFEARSAWDASGAGRLEYRGVWASSTGERGTWEDRSCWGADWRVIFQRSQLVGQSPAEESGDESECLGGKDAKLFP
jgi:hypothetical protein